MDRGIFKFKKKLKFKFAKFLNFVGYSRFLKKIYKTYSLVPQKKNFPFDSCLPIHHPIAHRTLPRGVALQGHGPHVVAVAGPAAVQREAEVLRLAHIALEAGDALPTPALPRAGVAGAVQRPHRVTCTVLAALSGCKSEPFVYYTKTYES